MRFKIIIALILFSAFLFSEDFLDIIKENNFLPQNDIEYMEYLLQNPINAKNVTEEFLEHYFFLPDSTAKKIIFIIKNNKINDRKFVKKLHLKRKLLQTLKNYITFQKTNSYHKIYIREQYKNYYDKYPLDYTLKYFYKKNNIRFGSVIQKDAKEPDYADYTSLFLSYKKNNLKLILGNYKIYCGVIYASQTAFYDPFYNNRFYVGLLKENASTYENFNLRGIGFEYTKNNITFLPYFSYSRLSAELNEQNQIESFNISGYHYHKKPYNVSEKLIGGLTKITHKFGLFILDIHFLKFDKQFENPKYHSNNIFWGAINKLDYKTLSFISQNVMLQNKYISDEKIIIKSKKFSQSISYRYYSKYFPRWHTNYYSHFSDNEKGWLYSLNLHLYNKINLSFFTDIYSQIKAEDNLLKNGSANGIRIFYNKKKYKIRLIYKYNSLKSALSETTSHTANLYWIQNIHNNLSLKSYFAFSNEQPDKKNGFLIYQQLTYRIPKMKFIARITSVKTEIPVFVYENNVPGIFQIKQFTKDDFAFFILLSAKISKQFDIAAKYSNSLQKKDKKEIYLSIAGKL